MAAENARRRRPRRRRAEGFNEAAAHGRGKPVQAHDDSLAAEASMRPRRMAAENGSGALTGRSVSASLQ